MNKKANVTLYIVFIIMATIIILITAVVAPMGVLFTTQAYAAGEDILLQANSSISDINNTQIRGSVQSAIGAAIDAGEFNIEVNTDLYQYSWIIVLLLVALVIFLFSRRLVEYGQLGFI